MTPRETIRAELEAIAASYGLTLKAVTGRSRIQPRPKARQAMWALLRAKGWTYPRIARLFNRDHSTVIFGVRRHCERVCVTFPQFSKMATSDLVNIRGKAANKSAAQLSEAA